MATPSRGTARRRRSRDRRRDRTRCRHRAHTLSDRLRRLCAFGVLAQVDAPSGRRQVYELTVAGKDLFGVVVALRQWGERHAFADGEPRSTLVDGHGEPVPRLIPTDSHGQELTCDDARVVHVRPPA
ncbi:winged helix-turn-helix transcriptional regulator [Cellulomonas sp. HD19AZ1]|uniref:winged helix-turn-helix transcriptional regulator n=1 Tax=Cellulomonas TaxID=1707 RepID=UPI00107081CD|nr:winged helix-turn-helix transcriptional regulator [Cellulomonas sp. HD19AZ1]TFH74333.1 transcriptional regulator [Cellulomonas sp. HD19AZ1]